MKIEHLGLNVKDPVAMAQWYERNLGMRIVRKGGPPAHTHFLADDSGQVMFEIYCNTKAPMLDLPSTDLLTLHLAFLADDVVEKHRQLLAAGATPLDAPTVIASGDQLAVIRDPWGLAVQLVKRAKPMS